MPIGLEIGEKPVAHQFDDAEQQRETATLGFWTFLATEVLFFGALFLAYSAYRVLYPSVFAEASQSLNAAFGGINTAILLTSSLTMALAVHSSKAGKMERTGQLLLLTALLGLLFLGVKALEYREDWEKFLVPGIHYRYAGASPDKAQLFFYLYFFMTIIHAIHLTIGIAVVSLMAVLSWLGRFDAKYHTPIELTGLYWHFVDIVWVFLFPLLYLLERHR